MKKKIVTICLVVALLLTAAGGTLAYFTDSSEKDNTFTVGNVDIKLTEEHWVSQGQIDAEDVYPGEPLAKDPVVTNQGSNPCFVRISVTGLDVFGEENMIQYRTNGKLDTLGAGWVLYEDGYYYYEGVLEVGASTPALFDHIVIPTTIGNGFGEEVYSVNVKAEAVQAQGAQPSFAAVKEMKTPEIATWFATCMN